MTLPIDRDSESYKFYKTLNEDVLLKPNEYNEWDIQMENGDYKNVDGFESLKNAICIAIMTRFGELQTSPIYNQSGCRVHELIKINKSSMVVYKIELFVTEVLAKMRRIQSINWVEITEDTNFSYNISFSVYSITDELIEGSVKI